MKKLNLSKKITLVVLMFSFSTNASAGWWGDAWGWIKLRKKTVVTVGTAVGITGLYFGISTWIKKRRLEQEKKRRIEEEKKKRIEEERIKEKQFRTYYSNKFLKKYREQLKPKNREELLKTVAKFKEKFFRELLSSDWVGKKDINGQKIQKVEMPDDAEIVMFTDLHSCAKALKQFLALMHHREETKDGNIFKLKDDWKKHLAFLGDYVDRGEEGVDVIHIIFNLFINNPKKVFLLRGNHEDVEMWEDYGFNRELDKLSIYDNKINGYDLYILEKLPSLLLVAHENEDNKKRCYLLGHGAIDKDLDLKEILKSDKKVVSQKISFKSSENMRWSGFLINKPDRIEESDRGAGYMMGKNIFAKYCKEQSENRDVEIVGMFRGHQHGAFESQLEAGNGLYILNEKKQWDGKTSSSFSINNTKPFVATLAPFRYSKYAGMGSETHKATIVSLKLDKNFNNCKITCEVMKRVKPKKKK